MEDLGRKALLGDVEFDVMKEENPDYSNTITDKPVEDGKTLVHHIRNELNKFRVRGVMTGEDGMAAQKYAKLIEYRDEKELLEYVGRNALFNVVISSLKTVHDAENRNGFTFDLELKEMRFAKIKTIEIVSPPPTPSPPAESTSSPSPASPANITPLQEEANLGTNSQAKESDDKGRQQPIHPNQDPAINENLSEDEDESIANSLFNRATNYFDDDEEETDYDLPPHVQ